MCTVLLPSGDDPIAGKYVSYQGFLRVPSRLSQGKVSKTFSHLRRLRGSNGLSRSAIDLLVRLSRPAVDLLVRLIRSAVDLLVRLSRPAVDLLVRLSRSAVDLLVRLSRPAVDLLVRLSRPSVDLLLRLSRPAVDLLVRLSRPAVTRTAQYACHFIGHCDVFCFINRVQLTPDSR
jgi:hypothetical protein